MREIWSVRLVYLTGVLVVALSVGFACKQNAETTAATAEAPAVAASAAPAASPAASAANDPVVEGRRVYERQNCARCHAIGGEGNRRNPLDGVGARLSAAEARDWIIGGEALKDDMSPSAFRAKQRYAELPTAEIDALVAYMLSLK
jgi:mono/diheme cytochrome c family protein